MWCRYNIRSSSSSVLAQQNELCARHVIWNTTRASEPPKCLCFNTWCGHGINLGSGYDLWWLLRVEWHTTIVATAGYANGATGILLVNMPLICATPSEFLSVKRVIHLTNLQIRTARTFWVFVESRNPFFDVNSCVPVSKNLYQNAYFYGCNYLLMLHQVMLIEISPYFNVSASRVLWANITPVLHNTLLGVQWNTRKQTPSISGNMPYYMTCVAAPCTAWYCTISYMMIK